MRMECVELNPFSKILGNIYFKDFFDFLERKKLKVGDVMIKIYKFLFHIGYYDFKKN